MPVRREFTRLSSALPSDHQREGVQGFADRPRGRFFKRAGVTGRKNEDARGAEFRSEAYGCIGGDGAIHEQPAIDPNRGEDARNRCASENGIDRRSARERNGQPLKVGRHHVQGNRRLFKLCVRYVGGNETAQARRIDQMVGMPEHSKRARKADRKHIAATQAGPNTLQSHDAFCRRRAGEIAGVERADRHSNTNAVLTLTARACLKLALAASSPTLRHCR